MTWRHIVPEPESPLITIGYQHLGTVISKFLLIILSLNKIFALKIDTEMIVSLSQKLNVMDISSEGHTRMRVENKSVAINATQT